MYTVTFSLKHFNVLTLWAVKWQWLYSSTFCLSWCRNKFELLLKLNKSTIWAPRLYQKVAFPCIIISCSYQTHPTSWYRFRNSSSSVLKWKFNCVSHLIVKQRVCCVPGSLLHVWIGLVWCFIFTSCFSTEITLLSGLIVPLTRIPVLTSSSSLYPTETSVKFTIVHVYLLK